MEPAKSQEKAAPSSLGKIIVVGFVVSTVAIAATIVGMKVSVRGKIQAAAAAASASAGSSAPPAPSANPPR